MPHKKIILIGTTAGSFYGFRSDLIKSIKQKNHQIFAFISEYKNENELEKVRALGAEVVVYQINRGGLNPLSDIVSTFCLKEKIKNIQADIVFSFFVKPVIFGTIAAKFAKVPHIVGMLEGLGFSFTEQPDGLNNKAKLIRMIQIFLYKISLPKLDTLIFLNSDDQKDLIFKNKIKANRVEILGGIGLNLREYSFHPISKITSPIRFLFIGRLLKEKGIHEFIQAVRIVKNLYPDTIFTVLGAIDFQNPGSLSADELNKLVASNLIEYPGHVDNVQDWIQKCHVFVLPSYREGVPRSTQEAMAIGRAVITTDTAGCRETVTDGVNGFLVPRWNAEKLAEKMIFFIENPEKIIQMGMASHQMAKEKFDANKVNARLLDILNIE